MPIPALATAIALAAQPGRICLHHASQCRNARRQAEPLKTRSDLLPSLFNDCRRENPRRRGRLIHGVALLEDSAPRAYRLQVGNAYLTFSTSVGTSPIYFQGTYSERSLGASAQATLPASPVRRYSLRE